MLDRVWVIRKIGVDRVQCSLVVDHIRWICMFIWGACCTHL